MRCTGASTFVVLLLLLPANAGDAPVGSFRAIDDAVNAAIEQGKLPGAVVLILHEDAVIHRKAYGHRARQPEPTLMTEDTVFDLASLTKPIATALALLLLVEDGKLDVHDRLAKHLPAFARKETEAITLEQLLLHTSGFIPDNPLDDYQHGEGEAWRRLQALNPTAPPGSRFQYSDVNYILLGRIVEKVSGESLDGFTRRRIFAPLSMKATGFRPAAELRQRAAPTQKRDGKWLIGAVHDPRAHLLGGVAGHAGLFSTADDLAIYARMLLNGGRHDGKAFLKPATHRLFTAAHDVPGVKEPAKRTYGWDMTTPYSGPRGDVFAKGVSYGHSGFTGTSLWLDPPSATAVIILSNAVHPEGKGDVRALRRQVATLAARAVARRHSAHPEAR